MRSRGWSAERLNHIISNVVQPDAVDRVVTPVVAHANKKATDAMAAASVATAQLSSAWFNLGLSFATQILHALKP
jgi:hypothetical protein